jgi:hypothetical protein
MDFPTRSRDELLAVCRFLRNFPCPWWLGGGWAIDSWLGSQSRDHEDIEICVARHDQGLIYSYCAAWDFLTPVNDQWAPLPTGTWLAVPQFMLQLQQTTHTRSPSLECLRPSSSCSMKLTATNGSSIAIPISNFRSPALQIARHGECQSRDRSCCSSIRRSTSHGQKMISIFTACFRI